MAVIGQRLGGAAVEGAMLGRAAWKRPWDVLGDADRFVFGAPTNAALSRRQVCTVLYQMKIRASSRLGMSHWRMVWLENGGATFIGTPKA